jgi:hypothetical protein
MFWSINDKPIAAIGLDFQGALTYSWCSEGGWSGAPVGDIVGKT